MLSGTAASVVGGFDSTEGASPAAGSAAAGSAVTGVDTAGGDTSTTAVLSVITKQSIYYTQTIKHDSKTINTADREYHHED